MSLTNAKQELEHMLKESKAIVKCAKITKGNPEYYNPEYDDIRDKPKKYNLIPSHTPEQLDTFLNSLNFNYDPGYGGQELFGIVWLIDGTWLERGEYDGSEWWEHKKCPVIPF